MEKICDMWEGDVWGEGMSERNVWGKISVGKISEGGKCRGNCRGRGREMSESQKSILIYH